MKMKTDLLKRLYKKEIGIKKAYDYQDMVISSKNLYMSKNLGLSQMEMTAHSQAIPLEVIARFRYKGWPKVCWRCKKEIKLKKYGWWIRRDERLKSKYKIGHLQCPNR